jgi:hypothetical protein
MRVLREWTGTGNWAAVKTNFTAAQTDVGMLLCKESGLVSDDVIIVQNGTDNATRFHKDSTGTWAEQDLGSTTGAEASPPKSTVMAWYRNRVWILKNDLLYFSTAYPADYATAFDTVTGAFRIPVGAEMAIVPTRDLGILIFGDERVYNINPSFTPSADADQPEVVLENMGAVSKGAVVSYGDDVYFFSQDGFRSLKRTVQDKLQLGVTFPVSYRLETEYKRINWAYIDRLKMKVFDNKVFMGIPTGATTFDTWIYYPAIDGFVVLSGWTPSCWETFYISGEERLYMGDFDNGVVYRAWYGYDDDGTAIDLNIEGRREDCGQPLLNKGGGELEITAEAAGSGNTLSVSVSKDGEPYTSLGTVDLTSTTAPVLPIALPFYLGGSVVVRQKFHLDSLGAWRTLQIKITNTDVNVDPIIVYGYNIITYLEEIASE